MLFSYASGEILSARQKPDNGHPKGDVIGKRSFPRRGTKYREEKNDSLFTVSRLLVTGDTLTVTTVCGFRHADGISPDA